MKLIFLILLFGFIACEPCEEVVDPFECMTCLRMIKENGMVTDQIELFVCGIELMKQKNINYIYINEYSGNLIEVSTVCYSEPCKDDKNR